MINKVNSEGIYSKDRESIFKWAVTTMGILGISFLGMIYTEQREANIRMNEILITMAKNQKDVEFMTEKNKEQDKRLDYHDQVLFTKPDDINIKKF